MVVRGAVGVPPPIAFRLSDHPTFYRQVVHRREQIRPNSGRWRGRDALARRLKGSIQIFTETCELFS